MSKHKTPELSEVLSRRIRLVRRDIGTLLFHFTRAPAEPFVNVSLAPNRVLTMPGNTFSVLRKILYEGKLNGTSGWTYGHNCVCFTEAPIQEFNSIFSLVELASCDAERPRYEPYGIAVSKSWLFERGGRPVIYDHPNSFNRLLPSEQYRFVPYDPANGIDFTWEREWRIKTDELLLESKHSLVVVPTAEDAFELVYEFAEEKPDWESEGSRGEAYIAGTYHVPQWLAVSLDLFGFTPVGAEPETAVP